MASKPGLPKLRLPSAAELHLVAAVVALAAAVLLAAGWAAERGLRARETARIDRELEHDARLVREQLAGEPLGPERGEALQEAVLRASRAGSVRVTLVAPDGTVLADSNVPVGELGALESHARRPEVQAALAGRVGRATRASRSVGRRLLYLASPAA
jgi:two-component system phosphate regulon sensor histidine kinase PhoR